MNPMTYSSHTQGYTSPSEITSYFYKELDLKNKQISELKVRINSLLDNKQNLQSQIEDLKMKNYSLSSNCEQETQMTTIASQKKENELKEQINYLLRENEMLKQRCNQKEGVESNFQNTITYKLHQAQKEIDNLSVMNTYKDNLLSRMQDFYNKINNIAGTRYNYTLDYCNDDLNVYMRRMKEIEDKVIHQLQFEDFHQNTTYFGNQNNNTNNTSNNNIIGKTNLIVDNNNNNGEQNQNIKAVNQSQQIKKSKAPYKIYHAKTPQINFTSEERYVNKRSCNCAYKQCKSPTPKAPYKYNCHHKETSLTRTPPRDEDYISPTSEKMGYLRTINEFGSFSRKNYNFYP